MAITLNPKVAAVIREKVESGSYRDVDDVIEQAVALLDRRDRVLRLRASLEETHEEFERGDFDEWSPELMAEIFREGDEMVRQGMKPDPDVCP